jgi:hypothetical protein
MAEPVNLHMRQAARLLHTHAGEQKLLALVGTQKCECFVRVIAVLYAAKLCIFKSFAFGSGGAGPSVGVSCSCSTRMGVLGVPVRVAEACTFVYLPRMWICIIFVRCFALLGCQAGWLASGGSVALSTTQRGWLPDGSACMPVRLMWPAGADTQAEQLRRCRILMAEEDRPSLEGSGEFYVTDLMGLDVFLQVAATTRPACPPHCHHHMLRRAVFHCCGW